MNKIVSFLKRIRLDRALIALLAGLMVFTTACNGAANAGVAGTDRPGVSGQGKINGRDGYQNETYDPIAPKQGGMNEYSDIDPRTNTRGAEAKAKALVDSAERNVTERNDELGTSTKRVLENRDENLRNLGDNIKDRFDELGRQTQQTVDTAREGTRQAGEDLSKNTRRAADAVQDKASEAADRTQRTVDKAGNAADRSRIDLDKTSRRAGDSLKDRANDAVDGTQRALDKTQDRIND